MAGAFLMIYELGKSLGMQSRFALLSVLFIITCRWTLYVCGLPLVDSLYFFILTATLYAITTQNLRWTYAVMLLGPWAKESFIFIAPLIFLWTHSKTQTNTHLDTFRRPHFCFSLWL